MTFFTHRSSQKAKIFFTKIKIQNNFYIVGKLLISLFKKLDYLKCKIKNYD